MELPAEFSQRPVVVAVAGPNGAGKTTFYHAHLKRAALPFINADVLSGELLLGSAAAMRMTDALRRALVERRESFVFETVFSDPVGDKLQFLKDVAASGYTVILCYIGIAGPAVSEERVAMRVSQGGHDVPSEKLQTRYSRTLANLKAAIAELPHVLVFDNSNLNEPFQQVAVFRRGSIISQSEPAPDWLQPLLAPPRHNP